MWPVLVLVFAIWLQWAPSGGWNDFEVRGQSAVVTVEGDGAYALLNKAVACTDLRKAATSG